MRKLIVVRHGNTFDEGETPTRVGARTDLPLSVSGQAQATALADFFKGTAFSAAACSTLMRTRQTARAILGDHAGTPPLLILPFLTEIDYGPDENQPEPAVIERLGEAALKLWDDKAVPPAGWQVDPGVLRQAWARLLKQMAEFPDGATALVVTSNGIARFLPDIVDHVPADLVRKLKTGAWGEIELSGGQSRITAWNRRP